MHRQAVRWLETWLLAQLQHSASLGQAAWLGRAAWFMDSGARHVGSSLATTQAFTQVNWGSFSVVTTGYRRVVTTQGPAPSDHKGALGQ